MTAVAVVGLGKLGAVLAGVLADRGHEVIGVDVTPSTVFDVNTGHAPVDESGLQDLYDRVKLRATTDMAEAVAATSIAFVIVPTPSGRDGAFVNDHVIDAVTKIGEALADNDRPYTVVICSTVMPGSTRGPIRDALEAAAHRMVGEDIGVAYSPEFIALGSVIHDMTHPDVVLVGADDELSMRSALDVIATIPHNTPSYQTLSTVNAEIAKLAVNTYVTMKISFANNLGEICERIPGADATAVCMAIGADSRIGGKYLRPGGPYGGPCFPRDTDAFEQVALRAEKDAPLAAATSQINERLARRTVARIARMDISSVDRIAVLGLAYKPGTAVTERSFGSMLVERLSEYGEGVRAFDPAGANNEQPPYSTDMTAQAAMSGAELVVIATPWPEFATLDYTGVRVIDFWGIVPPGPNVERFGTC